MLDFWYKESPPFPKDHKDFWRTRLIAHSLLITTSYFLVLTLLNLFYFQSYDIALIDALGLFVSLGIYVGFNKSTNVNAAAWAVTLMVCGLIILFIISVGGHAHSLFWATLIPPFAFFLVGRNWGSALSAVAFIVCAYLVYQQQQQTITIGLGSLFNVIEVSLAHILIFRFYEKTRFSAYNRLSIRNLEIQQLAETDKLTGLYNRQKFDFELSKLIANNANSTTDNANIVLICDIDHFKNINDTYGHLVGDNVLTGFAKILKEKLTNNALIARWGGEEFTIILSNTCLSDSVEQANELREYIAKNTITNIAFTISIGLATVQKDDTVLKLLERADKALYKAKNNGRNKVSVSDNNCVITANSAQPSGPITQA
ncbi:GGDEF domain-containing protein [Pseudoalteromonas sp. SWXJZ94C]|uniref:GGDEF domain-containing protein n=1 Tax=unclassified Pseudoalteromonas TaxID=194690 RepID=UPI0004187593|nr:MULTISPECIES: GGDEF domain-containing protein [unclassified Pseudoalteromonas]MBH0057860.1 GGDEF domain-containing protein [Pseudoalteromonas sp. SWXJZ94C]